VRNNEEQKVELEKKKLEHAGFACARKQWVNSTRIAVMGTAFQLSKSRTTSSQRGAERGGGQNEPETGECRHPSTHRFLCDLLLKRRRRRGHGFRFAERQRRRVLLCRTITAVQFTDRKNGHCLKSRKNMAPGVGLKRTAAGRTWQAEGPTKSQPHTLQNQERTIQTRSQQVEQWRTNLPRPRGGPSPRARAPATAAR
jgi:hypothetical protein